MEGVSFQGMGEVSFEGQEVCCLVGAGPLPDEFVALAKNAESIGGDFPAVTSVIPPAEKRVPGEVDLLWRGQFDDGKISRQCDFPEADIFKLDGRAFGFETEEAACGGDVIAAGNFLSVHPKPDFTIDGADEVVIPFVDALGRFFGREAAATIGRDGGEGGHFYGADREDVAMATDE